MRTINCESCGMPALDRSTRQDKKYCTAECRERCYRKRYRKRSLMRRVEAKLQPDLEGEVWRDVKDWETYFQVSNMGRVRQNPEYPYLSGKSYPGRLTTLHPTSKGYLRVFLRRDGVIKVYPVHRLVGFAFIPNPDNKPQINHKNFKKDDNRVANLVWCTGQENVDHYMSTVK